jgi:hypothetical protein
VPLGVVESKRSCTILVLLLGVIMGLFMLALVHARVMKVYKDQPETVWGA